MLVGLSSGRPLASPDGGHGVRPQVLQAAHHDVASPLERLDVDPQVGKAREKAWNRRAPLRPGEPRAEAEVDAVAERQVRVRLAIEPQLVGLVEHLGIAVGRADAHDDLVAGSNRLPAELEVLVGHAGRELHRALEAQQLLDGRADQPGSSRSRAHASGWR